jgi:hypothetical protein
VTEDYVKRIKELHEVELLQLDGVQGVGIGEDRGQPAITVYVDDCASAERLAIPQAIENVPVMVEESGVFRAY